MQQILKANIRDMLAAVLSMSGMTKFSRFSNSSISILTFHRVLPADLRDVYPLPGIAITPDELYWLLSLLKEHFEVQTVSDAFASAHAQKTTKPLLAISFDDGQWDNLEYALPVLSALELPATFYIPTAYIGGDKLLWHDEAGFTWQHLVAARQEILQELSPGPMPTGCLGSALVFLQYLKGLTNLQRDEFLLKLKPFEPKLPEWARLLTWPEVRQLQSKGHEIGSHSREHLLLSQLPPKAQRKEINQSMQDIETQLGVKVRTFCYPDGDFDEQSLQILEQSDCDTAVTTRWGSNQKPYSCFKLRRFDMNSNCLRDRKGALSQSRLQLRMSPYQPGM